MSTTYTTTGSVRGSCGHKHRTLEGAVRCLERDVTGCGRQGGYSDREIVRSDGQQLYQHHDDRGHYCGWLTGDQRTAIEDRDRATNYARTGK